MIGCENKILVAGPCAAETRQQVLDTASRLKGLGLDYFRAGLWKPRTHPGNFEGVGAQGLEWLSEVKSGYGMKVCTEVAASNHVQDCLEAGIDAVWIGARTSTNPFLVQEIVDSLKGSDVCVFIKNPVNPDIELWSGAVERVLNALGDNIVLVHRGVSSFEKLKFRNDPEWRLAVEMKSRFPQLPLICDPSHIAGDSAFVKEIAQKAMDLGLDGLMVETHIDPESALSDTRQQLTPSELESMLKSLEFRSAESEDDSFNSDLEKLRGRIDSIDAELVELLGARMDISRQIGLSKKAHGITVLQSGRWNEVLSEVSSKAEERGLDPEFVRRVFNLIHDASVKQQG